MQTANLAESGTIEIQGWLCNGSINPLIRDFLTLAQIAGDELEKALWYCAIELEVHGKEKEISQEEIARFTPEQRMALFYRWYNWKNRPRWKHNEILPGIWTTAQLLARHGSLDCRSRCADLRDLTTAIRLTESYNEFEPLSVALAFEEFNLARFFNNNNPNTGQDCFDYFYGWEGSSVIYIRASFRYGLMAMDNAWARWFRVTPESFKVRCEGLAGRINADESWASDADEDTITWRLWWD